jgi:hypothetical protein
MSDVRCQMSDVREIISHKNQKAIFSGGVAGFLSSLLVCCSLTKSIQILLLSIGRS